jgi:hypothetical protein
LVKRSKELNTKEAEIRVAYENVEEYADLSNGIAGFKESFTLVEKE